MDMNKVLYQFECKRKDISPREFYNYVKRQFKERCGQNLNNWVEDYKTWAEPTRCTNHIEKYEHCLEKETLREVTEIKPFKLCLYYQGNYNCIIEYEDGNGYCYIMEYIR